MPGRQLLLLLKRYVSVTRSEGTAAAVKRAVRYLGRRLRRAGPRGDGAHGDVGKPLPPQRYLHGVWQMLAQQDAFHITHAPAFNRNRRQIAMIADLNLPQCRKYRVEQLASFWRGRDVEFEFSHYQDIPRATRIMQQATHLMEYRLQTGPAADMLRYEARRLRLPILYDLDDPLFSVSAYETYRNMEALDPSMKAHFVAEAPKYLSMMNGADVLSVSTPGMASHAALFSGRDVFLRRNFADEETLTAGAQAIRDRQTDDGLFRVAFSSGSQGHEVDLAEIIEPLSDFILKDTKRRFVVIGHFDVTCLPKALLPQVERYEFSNYGSYLTALTTAQCAVMPLCDDLFNRCKSGVRVIDAAAAGVPSIVANVGDLPQLVRDGETGFVANGASKWLERLQELAANPKAARHMGQAARRDLEIRWNTSDQPHIIAPELINWVEA